MYVKKNFTIENFKNVIYNITNSMFNILEKN